MAASEWKAWAVEHEAAQTAMTDRVSKIDAVAERIERDLVLLGATAIEDKLQEVLMMLGDYDAAINHVSTQLCKVCS